jgi:hypothetical protein
MNFKKIIWTFLVVLLVGLAIYCYGRFYFVYSEGTKAGQLNTFQKKGVIFKTYEGKLIQSGFQANVKSNEFLFSVESDSIAKQLMNNAGEEFELHYKRYYGSLPWRGIESYIVDSIYAIHKSQRESSIKPK